MTVVDGPRFKLGALSVLCCTYAVGAQTTKDIDTPSRSPRGWGIDACLTAHVSAAERAKYLPILHEAGINILRERGPEAALAELKTAGNATISPAALIDQPNAAQTGNALPEDLLGVFWGGERAAHEFRQRVDVWELVGEPDVGYCTDLPDHVVAYQKALYLGLKAGGRQPDADVSVPGTPIVLMGALALAPGPWLERAMANGLLEYTDAYNFHYYGQAEDLSGVIAAHRRIAAMRGNGYEISGNGVQSSTPITRGSSRITAAPLPLWITECGLNAVRKDDFFNSERRALQAEFTVKTADIAWRTREVAVFMPFILVHDGDPFAMTVSADRVLPAWTAYAEYTRAHPWGERPLARPPTSPNPVVVQWMPDNTTCVPHKVSGTYRFAGEGPIRGVIRIYNFSNKPISGQLKLGPLNSVRAELFYRGEMSIEPMAVQAIPVALSVTAAGYFREDCHCAFVERGERTSYAVFGVEHTPRVEDFTITPLPVHSVGARPRHPMFDEYAITSRTGNWIGTNGVDVEEEEAGGRRTEGGSRKPESGGQMRDGATWVKAKVNAVVGDPLRTEIAVAALDGLPKKGFIRLILDQPMDREFKVRVDLLDRKGQRFTIWENFGVSYFQPRATEVWLNLQDFNVYSWGRCTEDPTFHPEDVEEIQLRLYFSKANDPRTIGLQVAVPR